MTDPFCSSRGAKNKINTCLYIDTRVNRQCFDVMEMESFDNLGGNFRYYNSIQSRADVNNSFT